MNKRPPKIGERAELINTLLVDGNALFKVGFFGAKNEYNHRGEHIGGLYQFLTILRKLLNENLYHRVYVFWDGNLSGKLRYNIYPLYKSGRGKDYINGTHPVDESEVLQKIQIRGYLEDLFIRQLQHEVVESDDFIGYYCSLKRENEKITICTNDRDMSQLISDDVRIYFFDLKAYVDNTNYKSYFRHHPTNSALIKIICGDNSDTIKGVKGVKEKTLLTLFPELKEESISLEQIIKKATELQEKRLKNKQPRLKSLDNITNGTTDGPQGDKLYEINKCLIDLKHPMITDEAKEQVMDLIESTINPTDRGIKNVIISMKRDGLERTIGSNRYSEYLLPFKRLIEREIKK